MTGLHTRLGALLVLTAAAVSAQPAGMTTLRYPAGRAPMMPIAIPAPTPEQAETIRIADELLAYVPGATEEAPPHGDAICQADKMTTFGRAFSRTLRCHRDAASRGAAVDSACVLGARTFLEERFAEAETGDCATRGDASRIARRLDRVVAKMVALLRPGDGPSACVATKLEVTAFTERRVLDGYAASRRTGKGSEPFEWGYRLRRQFERAEARAGDCRTRRDWRAVVHHLVFLHDDVVAALWPAPSLGVAYWKRLGFRINAREVTTRLVVMDDFLHAWDHGSFPEERAEVSIWSEPRPAHLVREVALRCLDRCTTTYVRVDGKPGMRAEWSAHPIDDMRRVAVCVADGHRVRWFEMLDHGHDASAVAHRAAFDAMLEQVELD